MYCNKCGGEIADGQEFCSKCGQRVGAGTNQQNQQYQQYTVSVREKSAGVAAVLSLIWAGLGQIYVGKIGLGLMLIIIYPILLFGGLIVLAVALGLIGLIVFAVIVIVVWIWNIFNAYQLANEYNDAIRATGRRPW
ncbi:MAG: zinc ribbon domain-containing protein [Methanomassiliicoccaceae archaeon]|jgi:TM2 domain-containing membrane protein YozV|nr:zinc ribbon domain-containing protein [Methanomassiliicoccaceae archaeon]